MSNTKTEASTGAISGTSRIPKPYIIPFDSNVPRFNKNFIISPGPGDYSIEKVSPKSVGNHQHSMFKAEDRTNHSVLNQA